MTNRKTSSILALVIYVVFAITTILLFPDKGNVFWTGFGFTTVAFITSFLLLNVYLKNDNKTSVKFLNINFAIFSMIYVVAQVVAFIVVLVKKVEPNTLPIVIYVVLLGVYLALTLLTILGQEVVHTRDVEVAQKREFIFTTTSIIQSFITNADYSFAKKNLSALQEKFKFSDPMSGVEVADIENEIEVRLNNIQTTSKENFENELVIIGDLLSKRNDLVKFKK